LGKSVAEVQSWPGPVLVEWQAHLEMQHEARSEPQADDAAVEEKLKKVLKPRN
jgi:hypothetical protein